MHTHFLGGLEYDGSNMADATAANTFKGHNFRREKNQWLIFEFLNNPAWGDSTKIFYKLT